MPDDVCLDCGVFLSPSETTCPVCGFDNRWAKGRREVSMTSEPISGLTDTLIPEMTPGY